MAQSYTDYKYEFKPHYEVLIQDDLVAKAPNQPNIDLEAINKWQAVLEEQQNKFTQAHLLPRQKPTDPFSNLYNKYYK